MLTRAATTRACSHARRMNDNSAGKLGAAAALPSANYPGFAGGLFVGYHTASVLVSQSDLGGNCAWLGSAVVSLVDRSTNTSDLRGMDSAGLVAWLEAGEAGREGRRQQELLV